MTRPHYCDMKGALVSVRIRSAEHARELREERFCSEGRQCPITWPSTIRYMAHTGGTARPVRLIAFRIQFDTL